LALLGDIIAHLSEMNIKLQEQ